MGFFDRLKKGLTKTRENFTHNIERLIIGYADIDDELIDDLEETLLMADVGVKTTETLIAAVRKGIKQKEIRTPEDLIPFLEKEIVSILEAGENTFQTAENGATVLLVVGTNGVGKTTTIGKLSAYYRRQGKSVLLAAADTFRAAAIDQLEIWGKRADAQVIKHGEGSDPAAVVFDAMQAAKARNIDIVIVDTAGRLQTKSNLMQELEKIYRVIGREIPGAPHETLLVLDAGTGQNAISQAELFTQAAPVSGVVLTKLDGTAKGGVTIGIKSQLSIPIKWIGVGEGIDDLRPFRAEDFVSALFVKREDEEQE
ncbi:signal recognition particle-docking protein FtsY [uncultured Selenomonas sp.]|uniref:signal recognition particle-docking protein FtsY n=1 Tax=uncultured Selenomonas sp. TaxID=159275 RepID=UPI0028EF6F76|nr:signal recognition particle-docking protein FtsY [uncultured Selenomonas sp.]